MQVYSYSFAPVSAERPPENHNQRNHRDSDKNVETVSAEDSRGKNLDDDEKREEHGIRKDSRHRTSPEYPLMTGRLWGELLERSKLRNHRLSLRNRGLFTSSHHTFCRRHSLVPTVPTVGMFVLNFRFTIQTAPHNFRAFYSSWAKSQGLERRHTVKTLNDS